MSPLGSWVSDLPQAAEVARPESKRPGWGVPTPRAPRNYPSDPSTRCGWEHTHGIPTPNSQVGAITAGAWWGKRLISLMEKRLNKSNPKPALANQLTCSWRLCEGGRGRARLPARESRWGVGRGRRSKCQIREREDERRGRKKGARLQRGEVGRHGDSTGSR